MTIRIGCYARCSTLEQRPEVQAHALAAYCDRRGAEYVEFIDHGQSGAKNRRPALRVLRASRSSFTQATASIARALALTISASRAGLRSLDPETPWSTYSSITSRRLAAT